LERFGANIVHAAMQDNSVVLAQPDARIAATLLDFLADQVRSKRFGMEERRGGKLYSEQESYKAKATQNWLAHGEPLFQYRPQCR
jgi:hypothetical protein